MSAQTFDSSRRWLLLGSCAVAFAGAGIVSLRAQAPGVPIVEQAPTANAAASKTLITNAEALRQAGKLLDLAAVKSQIAAPRAEAITLPKPGRKRLAPAEVAARARAAYLQVGWYYLCRNCDKWHANLAAGYAITAGGAVVTCEHVIQPSQDVREGFLIAANEAGQVFPVTAVLARNQRMDAAIVRVAGAKFTPLPLNDQIRPGDSAFCYSEPLGQVGYFSAGIVNRFYWNRTNRGAADDTLDALRYLRFNVSTDWAPGSSGAAVLDDCGNAIGHVSVISTLGENRSPPERQPKVPPKDPPKDQSQVPAPAPGGTRVRPRIEGTLMVVHEAVPARGVMLLVKSMKDTTAAQPAPVTKTTAQPGARALTRPPRLNQR